MEALQELRPVVRELLAPPSLAPAALAMVGGALGTLLGRPLLPFTLILLALGVLVAAVFLGLALYRGPNATPFLVIGLGILGGLVAAGVLLKVPAPSLGLVLAAAGASGVAAALVWLAFLGDPSPMRRPALLLSLVPFAVALVLGLLLGMESLLAVAALAGLSWLTLALFRDEDGFVKNVPYLHLVLFVVVGYFGG